MANTTEKKLDALDVFKKHWSSHSRLNMAADGFSALAGVGAACSELENADFSRPISAVAIGCYATVKGIGVWAITDLVARFGIASIAGATEWEKMKKDKNETAEEEATDDTAEEAEE